MDVQHHGRFNRDRGETPNQLIFGALIAADPMAAFAEIDIDSRERRRRRRPNRRPKAAFRPFTAAMLNRY
jgi:hypothetical protein